jgi:uncharacterized membrane protein
MAIGPVQLLVLGFPEPNFQGQIIAELERLRENDMVRVVDSLVIYKDEREGLEIERLSNLSQDQAIEMGSKIGALIGLGAEGEEGFVSGALAGAAAGADGVQVIPDEAAWDIIEDIPPGSAAALLLLEHHWAVSLRDAVMRAGGYRVSDGFISPADLVEIGMASADEAAQAQLIDASIVVQRPPSEQEQGTATRTSG